MKNKVFMAGVLAMTFAFAGNVYAVSQNSNSGAGTENQVEQQTQTANQGETNQIQTQNGEQVQAGTNAGTGAGTQIQQQTQQKLQNGTGAGDQIQDQNQVRNQGEASQLQNSQQQGTQEKNGTTTATQRRSQVANAVQEILQVAERNSGVGQQIRTIAQDQNQNQEKIEASLKKVQSRGGFAKFFIGANYGEINNTQKLLEQNREQIKQLNQIKNQLTNQGDVHILTQQIQTLEQADLQIENLLQNVQKGFSLLGWMFKMFSN
ncbi:MAG: hypothetical protein WC244_03480 [Patescibacteria group bacterium]|jgi:hypothetical protein